MLSIAPVAVTTAVIVGVASDKSQGNQEPLAAFPLVRGSCTVSTQCAPGEIRTPNLLIRSQMLYPLSYGRS